MVDRRVELGQLNNTALTLKELEVIIDSFTATLKGTYHSRVDYPDDDLTAVDEAEGNIDDENLVEDRE